MPPSARLQRLFPFLAWPRPDAQLLRSEALAALARLVVLPDDIAAAAI
jgi:SulP family sulfate permease